MFRRTFAIVCLLLTALFAVMPVFAQQTTPDELVCDAFEDRAADIRVGYYMGQGAGFSDAGQYVAAINSYTCALRIDDDYLPAYIKRAIAHTERRDFEKALTDYTAALALDSSQPDVLNNRGIVYAASGDFDRALADFNDAISQDSDYLVAYNNRGIVQAIRGEYEAAIADFEQALTIDENYAQSYALIGMVHSRWSLESYRKYLELAQDRSDRRIQAAAESLDSRFTFELRFDDGTWWLKALFAD